jgi:uncharacterized cysteine cluster protein YcgN (CxxCxxCC family)
MAFWDSKSLRELSPVQWEALCDGCGRCCLQKLQDPDTGELFLTGVACRLLELSSCRCRDYARRQQRVPGCRILTPENVPTLKWLPSSCAYRLRAENRPLPSWHPLIAGHNRAVREAGVSVSSFAVSENQLGNRDLAAFIIARLA